MFAGANLSFDQAPPYAVPLRFLLLSPVFLVLAGAWGLLAGAGLWSTRWSPGLLALVHLYTLGVLGSAMLGAFLQLLPVVAGATVAGGSTLSRLGAPVWALAVAGLCLGFALGEARVLALAAVPLAIVLLAALTLYGRALWRAPRVHATVRGMRVALLALAGTAGLGLWLVASHAGHTRVALHGSLTDLHALWGGVGWVFGLVAAVAFQVVPLFHVTPEYPPRWQRVLHWLLLPALLALPLAPLALAVWLGGVMLVHAALSLRVLGQARRRVADVTVWHWRVAWASLLLAPVASAAGHPLTGGALFLAGFAASAVAGMLVKIVPFLAWLHLQNRATVLGRHDYVAPAMRQLLPEARAKVQFAAQALSAIGWVSASLWPVLTPFAALATLCAGVLQLALLGSALVRYRAAHASLARA